MPLEQFALAKGNSYKGSMPEERILIVDDDREIVLLLRSYLQQERYAVSVAYDGESALHALRRELPALVLLDLMLPDKDVWEITRTVRGDEKLAATLIIMLTTRVEDTDKSVGLELGADDYVIKPFNPREVVARVRALLRRTQRARPRAAALVVGALQIDVERQNVQVRGYTAELTPTEFSLLQTLMESPGYVFTRSELMDKALGYDYNGIDRMLDSHIKNLRRKIESDPRKPKLISRRSTGSVTGWPESGNEPAMGAVEPGFRGDHYHQFWSHLVHDATVLRRQQSALAGSFQFFQRGRLDRLEEHYSGHGSWQGVSPLLESANFALFFNAANRTILVLTDPEGQVLYATAGTDRPARLEASQLQQSLPISVEGRTIGFLDLVQREQQSGRLFAFSAPDDTSPGLAERASEFLLQVLLIGGVLAIVFGVHVSRRLSAPLTRLVNGTQAIARRDLSFRVSEQGSTEMREVSNSFNRMAAALEDAETLRRSMLNDIAHELRTPLTILEGNLRAILDDVYPLEKTEIARLYDQTRHLRLVVQAEARQLPLHRSPRNLTVLLGEVAELFPPLAGEKNISLDTSLPRTSVFAAVDRMRFAQALQNLLTNALQHTPAGGVITLSLRAEEETATITVADNGDGIAPVDIITCF